MKILSKDKVERVWISWLNQQKFSCPCPELTAAASTPGKLEIRKRNS